jgi:hypothetical protein
MFKSGKCVFIAFVLLVLTKPTMVGAEYGDVLINNYSDAAGMRPVVLDLGFKMEAGGNQINMLKIIDGEYCGACHNGEVAWAVENCDICHTGKPGQPTQVHQSTASKLTTTTKRKQAESAE